MTIEPQTLSMLLCGLWGCISSSIGFPVYDFETNKFSLFNLVVVVAGCFVIVTLIHKK